MIFFDGVMVAATCIATTLEKRRPLPVDSLVPGPIFTSTHAITMGAQVLAGGWRHDEPTPWIGLWERINISVFLLRVVVLASVLWRPVRAQGETL